ncbi:MAG: hypothetical protein ACLFVT_07535 [Syntrophobacteria bacterium]
MDDDVKKELGTLRGMVLRWKSSYLGYASGEEGYEFLADDLSEEIARHISPYVVKLHQFNHLSNDEANGFLDYCYGQVEELRYTLKEVNSQKEDEHA